MSELAVGPQGVSSPCSHSGHQAPFMWRLYHFLGQRRERTRRVAQEILGPDLGVLFITSSHILLFRTHLHVPT